MGTITTLNGDFDGTPWKQSFTDTLIRLCPALNPDLADEVADVEYRTNRELGPKLAAAQWAGREWSGTAHFARIAGNDLA